MLRSRPSQPSPKHFLLPLLYMGLIYLLSSVPGTVTPDAASRGVFEVLSPKVQNLLHIPLYGVLAYLWAWALGASRMRAKPLVLVAFTLTLAYGAFDEWHQLSVPGRYSSLTDLALNGIGAAVGVILYHQLTNRGDRVR